MEMAFKTRLSRVRELAAAAGNRSGLYDAHDHCKKAFELAEMNLSRWLSANPDASQAGEIRKHLKELCKGTSR